MLADQGLSCTTLSAVTPEADPSSPDPAVRRAGLDTLKWAIDASHALGSATLSGPLYAAAMPAPGVSGPTPDARARSAETLSRACAYAGQADIRLCLEFLNRFEGYLLDTAEDTLALVRFVSAPNLGIAFDTHHAQIEEGGIAAAITGCGDRLFHTHMSESNRGTLGSGTIEWDEVFGASSDRLRGSAVDRGVATDVQPLATSAHVWRDTLQSKDQVARDAFAFLLRRWEPQSTPWPSSLPNPMLSDPVQVAAGGVVRSDGRLPSAVPPALSRPGP